MNSIDWIDDYHPMIESSTKYNNNDNIPDNYKFNRKSSKFGHYYIACKIFY